MNQIPAEIRRIIFLYCGDVTRASICSVSKSWQWEVIAASKSTCAIPALYSCGAIILNKQVLQVIFRDYHLVVRYKIDFDYVSNSVGIRTTRIKYTMCKAGNVDVYMLYNKLFPHSVSSLGRLYMEPLFDVKICIEDALFGFNAVCYTGNIKNITDAFSKYLLIVPANGIIKHGLHTCARRGHVEAMRYILNKGKNWLCDHSKGICAGGDYYCFSLKEYYRMVSKTPVSIGRNYDYRDKYNAAINFLICEYLPRATNDMLPVYEYFAELFCESGNFYGFKLVLEKLLVENHKININKYLLISCLNPVMSLSEFIINAGATNIVECFDHIHTVKNKAMMLAIKCYEMNLLPLSTILIGVVHKCPLKDVLELQKKIPFTVEHYNAAFMNIIGDGWTISAENLIILGCTNYDKDLYKIGVYASI